MLIVVLMFIFQKFCHLDNFGQIWSQKSDVVALDWNLAFVHIIILYVDYNQKF